MTHIMYIEIENVTHCLTKANTQSPTTSAARQKKEEEEKNHTQLQSARTAIATYI